jgi:protease-4
MKSARVLGLLGASCLLLSAFPGTAFAQHGFARPTTLPNYGRDPISTRDSTVVVANPALLGFLPGAELRWNSQFLDERSRLPTQGHAIAFAFPISLIDLGLGARLDFISPPSDSGYNKYNVLTLGMGLKTSDTSALGLSYQHYYSEATQLHGLGAWALGWTARPWNGVGLGITGKAINSPSNDHFGRIDPAWDFALSIRPFGTDVVELGLVGGYVYPEDAPNYFAPRATLGVRIPRFGRLRTELAVVERSDRARDNDRYDWVLGSNLSVDFNGPGGSMSFGGSTLVGSGLGQDTKYDANKNVGIELAVRGFRETAGVEIPDFGVLFKINDTPSARKHVSLLRRLWKIAEREPAVSAVVFELRASPAEGTARAQELRDAIAYLRAHGKKVLCHVDQASGTSLYVCSQADKIVIHPGGSIRFAGFSSTQFYLKGLLDKLGVRADIVRIGDHKSAPEMFTREGPTEIALADRKSLMQAIEAQWLAGVAEGRKLGRDRVAGELKQGPLMSSNAKAAGLVDGYAYLDEVPEQTRRLVGRPVRLEESLAPRAPSTYGAHRRVAVVYVDGDMVDGKSQTVPFLGVRLSGAITLADTFKQLRSDPRVGAVVLRIDSPGGSALAADTLWRELQLLAHTKPVVCSMGSIAASGGYYIASATHRIFANPATVTGSIGVFSGKADVSDLLSRIGVGTNTIKTAPHADANSPFRPYTDEERAALFREISQLYDMFLTRVSLGRGLDKASIDRVGQGRVFTGEQALGHRLVDELGGLRQAIDWVERVAGLPADAPIIELPPPDASLLEQIVGLDGDKVQTNTAAAIVPPQLLDVARALSPFVLYEDEKPLMRLEGFPKLP